MTGYHLLQRLLPFAYRGKVLASLWAVCLLGAALGLALGGDPTTHLVVAAASGGLGTVFLLILLAPVRQLMESIAAWGRTGRVVPLPEDVGDDFGLALVRINLLMARAQRTLDTSWTEMDSDSLTGVLNSSGAERILGDAGAGWLIGIDLLALGLVTETGGPRLADDILIRVAQTCTEIVRQDDMVARLSDNRFVIFLPGAPREVAGRIVGRIAAQMGPDGGSGQDVPACFGIVRFAGGGDPQQCLVELNAALDTARQRGAGSVEGGDDSQSAA